MNIQARAMEAIRVGCLNEDMTINEALYEACINDLQNEINRIREGRESKVTFEAATRQACQNLDIDVS